ncbi:MAG: DMT family transporter [Patescibacteria group bacterium]
MTIGFIYAAGAAITWGLVYAIDGKILSTTSPLALLFVNSVVTTVIMLPFAFSDYESIRTLISSGKGNLGLVASAIILATAGNFFIFSAIKSMDASSASIIEIAYPFFVILFSFILYKTVPTLSFFIGGIFIFIGAAIIIYFNK